MADKITETNVLQITVKDTDQHKQSFNLQSPLSDTTIAQIREVFEPLIQTGKWYSNYDRQINYIDQATLTKTKKIELSDDTTIEVTPTQARLTEGTPATFTVTGSPIKGFSIIEKNYTGNVFEPTIDAVNNTITFTVSGYFTGNLRVAIVTVAGNIEVYMASNL